MQLSLKLFRLLSSCLKTLLFFLCQVSSTGTVSFLSYKFRFCWALFAGQYTTMSCLKIFAQHGYKVPNISHLPNSWAIMSFLLGKNSPHVGQIQPTCWAKPANTTCTCWANIAHMLGKYYPHVGQILSTCWANTVHMLGRFRPLLDTMVCLVLHKRLHFILSSRAVDPFEILTCAEDINCNC